MYKVHKHSLSNHLAQTWTHKLSLSLRQTQSTAAWSVRGRKAAGDYQVDEYNVMCWIQMPSLLFFQSTLFPSQQPTHNEYSDVVQYSVEWRCQEL